MAELPDWGLLLKGAPTDLRGASPWAVVTMVNHVTTMTL